MEAMNGEWRSQDLALSSLRRCLRLLDPTRVSTDSTTVLVTRSNFYSTWNCDTSLQLWTESRIFKYHVLERKLYINISISKYIYYKRKKIFFLAEILQALYGCTSEFQSLRVLYPEKGPFLRVMSMSSGLEPSNFSNFNV